MLVMHVKDFLAVLAAGNEGAASATNQGATSVTSPATAKNCITAGATEVANQTFTTNPQYIVAEMSLHQPSTDPSGDQALESYLVRPAKLCMYTCYQTLTACFWKMSIM